MEAFKNPDGFYIIYFPNCSHPAPNKEQIKGEKVDSGLRMQAVDSGGRHADRWGGLLYCVYNLEAEGSQEAGQGC